MVRRWFKSGACTVFLAAVAPPLFFFSRNYSQYGRGAILLALGWFAVLGLALGGLARAARPAILALGRGLAAAARAFPAPRLGVFALLTAAAAPLSAHVFRRYAPPLSGGLRAAWPGAVAAGVLLAAALFALWATTVGVFAWAARGRRRGGAVPRPHGPSAVYGAVAIATLIFFAYFIWAPVVVRPTVWLAGLAVPLLAAVWGMRPGAFPVVNVALGLFAVLSAADLARSEWASASSADAYRPPAAAAPDLTLARKPNIYLLYLESMHSRDVLRDLYGQDQPEFYATLARDGYAVYDDFIANYHTTLLSAMPLFSMRHHYNRAAYGNDDLRRGEFAVIGDDNNVFHLLKHNGYAINLFDAYGNYTFRFKSALPDYVYFMQMEVATAVALSAAGQINPWLVKTVQTLFPGIRTQNAWVLLQENVRFDRGYEQFASVYPERFDLTRPSFFFHHFGALHVQQPLKAEPGRYPGYGGWNGRYRAHYRRAVETVEKVTALIHASDPGALIILVGDHGAKRHGQYGARVADVNAVNAHLRAAGTPPRDMARHLTGVLLAIRWPPGIAPPPSPAGGLSHVNLFPFVFCALNGQPFRSEDYEPSVSYFGEYSHVIAAHGRYLEDWAAFEDFQPTLPPPPSLAP